MIAAGIQEREASPAVAADERVGGATDVLRPVRPAWMLVLVTLGLQGLVLAGLYSRFQRFFFVDDRIAQYLPMYRWLGELLASGRLPPLNVPELGMGGNLAADLQYGVLDPAHWLLSLMVYAIGDLNAASWALSGVALGLFATGTVLLLRSFGVPDLPAIAASVAAASSGCVLYVGAAWWPLMWASAFLPWLWLGLRAGAWRGPLITGLAAWLISGAGYPYVFPFAAAIVVGQFASMLRSGGFRRPTWIRVGVVTLAGVGGLLASLPGLLTAAHLNPTSLRSGDFIGPLGNTGTFIPNLGDVIFGSPTLMPIGVLWQQVNQLTLVPLMASIPGALAVGVLIRWRAALRMEGTVHAIALLVISVLATQLPEQVFAFRVSFRYLVDVQFFVCVLLALGLRAGVTVTRPRVLAAGGLVLVGGLLAVMRTPFLLDWHLVGTAVAALAVVGFALHLRRGRLARAAGIAALTAVVLGPIVGLAAANNAAWTAGVTPAGHPPAPVQSVQIGYEWSSLPEDYRERSIGPDSVATVIRWGNVADFGWTDGVLAGNGNLVAGFLPGFAYTSVGHKAWAERWCQNYLGAVAVCASHFDRWSAGNRDRTVDALLEEEQTTGRAWIDLMVGHRVLLPDETPARVVRHFLEGWREMDAPSEWRAFERAEPLPDGVSSASATADIAAAGDDTYRVSTQGAGRLTLSGPWWPGFVATLDGQELPVRAIEGTVPVLDLPADLNDATLRIAYSPWPARLFPGILVPAALAVAVAAVLSYRSERRARRYTAVPQPS